MYAIENIQRRISMKLIINYKQIFLIIFITLINQTIFCRSQSAKPEKVYRIVYVQKSNEWYQQQAKLWEQEIKMNSKNPEAWYNYYNAVRYGRYDETINTREKKDKLEQIIEDMGKAIPGTYEYYLLKYWNHYSMTDIEDLEKAYEINPNKPDTYYGFIDYYEHHGNNKKLKDFLTKLYESKDIAPGLINYNYNVLVTTQKNAILFTNGDNDTYPVWILQQVKNIRQDVTVLNTSLIMSGKPYLERKLNEKNITIDFDKLPEYRSKDFVSGLCKYIDTKYPSVPIYFALTVYSPTTESISDDLYLVGLAYKYSPTRMDNLAMLKNNWENNLRLDYLKNDWYSENYIATETIHKMLNQNYISPALLLYEHYKISGETTKAQKVKELALQISKAAGKEKEVMDALMKK